LRLDDTVCRIFVRGEPAFGPGCRARVLFDGALFGSGPVERATSDGRIARPPTRGRRPAPAQAITVNSTERFVSSCLFGLAETLRPVADLRSASPALPLI
jgi:hypothetical protein